MDPERSFDVVVIGAGFAGLAAGTRAAELGLRTAVLERGETSDYLCNSRISGGVFHVAHEDVTRPPAELFAAIMRDTHGRAETDLAHALAENVGPTMGWVQRLGGTFMRSGDVGNNTLMAAPPRPVSEQLDWMTSWQGRGPDRLIRLLADVLRAHGGELLLATTARSLLMEGGACVGVSATADGRTLRLGAGAVVIADGGFGNDPSLTGEHVSPHPERLCARNAGTAAGDGLRMAREAGADTTSLRGFYGHVLSRDALHNRRLWPYPTLDEVCVKGIVVDGTGERFCDEGRGGVFIANTLAGRENPLDALVVCDSVIWDPRNMRRHVSAPNPALTRLGGTIYSAETIEELAAAAGLPAAALRDSVEAHNRSVAGQPHAGPPRSREKYKAMAIAVPPFHAIPICAGLTFTMGGIRINAKAQALDTNGRPIPGLYAAGSATGGINVGDAAIYISGLSKALVFGKLAGDHIGSILAERASPGRPPPDADESYPALAFAARHGRSIGIAAAVFLVLAGLFVAAQTNGSLRIVPALAGLALGGLAYFLVLVLSELIRLITRTLLPDRL